MVALPVDLMVVTEATFMGSVGNPNPHYAPLLLMIAHGWLRPQALVERTEGASPAYIKELLRKAAIFAAAEGTGATVTAAQIEAALAELAEGGRLAQRLLGFHTPGEPTPPFPPQPLAVMGFPPGMMPPMPAREPR